MDSPRATPYLLYLRAGGDRLDEAQQSGSALRLAVRLAVTAFGAQSGGAAALSPSKEGLVQRAVQPRGAQLDLEQMARYLGARRPPMPGKSLLAPVRRNQREWGVIVLTGVEAFGRTERQDFLKLAEHLSRALERIDRMRLVRVRERIDRKVLEQVRPRDLFYIVLHGLHSLTHYDHSAAVGMVDAGDEIKLVAEQVAWRKGGSSVVGTLHKLTPAAREVLERGDALGFDRDASGEWRAWGQAPGEPIEDAVGDLLALLDYNRATGAPEERCERSMLCVPLVGRRGALGFLKVACRRPGFLGLWEADLVGRFMPQIAVSLRNLERASNLRIGAEAAERKSALADLARGVAHDVNNALGAALPLVQQLQADAAEGKLDAETLRQDLENIESSLAVCRRIFGGMLSFARSATHGAGDGNLRRALNNTLAVLGESCRRRGIELEFDIPERLPSVRCSQSDLEQLLLNLATNGRDAMPAGGVMRFEVKRADGHLDLAVRDTGVGIDPKDAAHVEEPFYSTKAGGSGLGLGICRAIVTRTGGQFRLESKPGVGTSALLRLMTEERGAKT